MTATDFKQLTGGEAVDMFGPDYENILKMYDTEEVEKKHDTAEVEKKYV